MWKNRHVIFWRYLCIFSTKISNDYNVEDTLICVVQKFQTAADNLVLTARRKSQRSKTRALLKICNCLLFISSHWWNQQKNSPQGLNFILFYLFIYLFIYRVPAVVMKYNSSTFQGLSRTPDINFQGLNVDISSYHYALRDISLTVKLHWNHTKIPIGVRANFFLGSWTIFGWKTVRQRPIKLIC